MNNIAEFKQYVTQRKPHKITFVSEDQDTFDVAEPVVMSITFRSIYVGENPDVIYLTDGTNSMKFHGVRRIQIREKSSVLGDEVRLSCLGREGETTYTLLVS